MLLKSLAHGSLNLIAAFYLWNNNSVSAFLMFLAFLTATALRWLIVCDSECDIEQCEHGQSWDDWACLESLLQHKDLLRFIPPPVTHTLRRTQDWMTCRYSVCVSVCEDYVRLMESIGLKWRVPALCVRVVEYSTFFLVQRCCSDSGFLFNFINRPGCWLAERQNKSLNALKCAGVAYGGGHISH